MPKEDLVRLKAELAPGYFTPVAVNGNGNGNGQDADKDAPLSTAQFVDLSEGLRDEGRLRELTGTARYPIRG
jgi:hypothetical protein